MTTPLSGAFPVLPTPVRSNGAIDETDFRAIIRFALESAVDGVVYPGVASEVDTLSEEERRRQVDLLAREIDNRIPIIIGASDPDPAVAARHLAHGAEIGAAAAMVMAPGHLGNSIEAQIEYFQQVAADAGVPIMLQNQPKPIGAGLTPEEVAAVASAVDMIRYVKEETPPCGQHLTRIRNAANGSVDAIFGGAGGRYVMDEMARGAAGTMPACELADIHAMMMKSWREGDIATARKLYSASLPLLNFQAIFRMHMTKEVLRRRGVIRNTFVRGKGPKFDEGDRAELTLLLQEAALPYKHHRPV
jgi:4-hydroxy-tetrahydrodipicolinate synthase